MHLAIQEMHVRFPRDDPASGGRGRGIVFILRGPIEEASMLKIQRSVDEAGVIFTLSGRIQGDDVAELQRLFALEAAGRRLVLDLQEVKLVDRDAVQFLARCEADGMTLVHCPAYIRRWMVRERDGKEAVRQKVVRRMKTREET